MPTFAIVLGCIAWVLSCFVCVSYFQAEHQQGALHKQVQGATAAAASVQAVAGRNDERLKQRVQRDEEAVNNDQRALQKTANSGIADAGERQVLAADQATLQADRMMQYTLENFARSDPDPEVTKALDRVDREQRQLADAVSTKERDRVLAHVLIALWFVVGGAAYLAFRRGRTTAFAEVMDHAAETGTQRDPFGDESTD